MIPARKVDDVTPSVYEYSRSSSNLVYIVLLCFDVFLCNCVFSCRIVEQLVSEEVRTLSIRVFYGEKSGKSGTYLRTKYCQEDANGPSNSKGGTRRHRRLAYDLGGSRTERRVTCGNYMTQRM